MRSTLSVPVYDHEVAKDTSAALRCKKRVVVTQPEPQKEPTNHSAVICVEPDEWECKLQKRTKKPAHKIAAAPVWGWKERKWPPQLLNAARTSPRLGGKHKKADKDC